MHISSSVKHGWPEAEAYKQLRVLITGGLGFMGLNVVAGLCGQAETIRILDLSQPPRSESLGTLLEGVQIYTGDMRDRRIAEEAVRGCDVIFNLAGKSGAVASNASPMEDQAVNVLGQLEFLEVCRRVNPQVKIVFASSRLVYKPTQALPVPEDAALGPLSIYGVHKLTGEHYHLLYAHLYGIRATILRITNPYGPFQRREQNRYGIVNWFIQLAAEGQPLPVYGDGLQLRDYVHVDDVVRAMLACGTDARADGQVFNVGGDQPITFRDMAQMIVRLAQGGQVQFVAWPPDAARTETGDFVADIRLIQRTIGWRPRVPLESGLAEVIRQYKGMQR